MASHLPSSDSAGVPDGAPRPGTTGDTPAVPDRGPNLAPPRTAPVEARRLAAIMQALPVGVAITDEAGGATQVNAEYDRIWGHPQVRPQRVEDYAPYLAWWADSGKPLLPEEWASAVAVREDRTVTGQFLEIQRFDGTRAFVLNSASPIHDAYGRVIGSAVAIQEVTELRRAQEALRAGDERYRTLAENFRVALKAAPITLATLDTDLRYTWVHNTRHGFTPEAVIGKRPDELLPPENVRELMALLRDVRDTGRPAQREITGHVDGTDGQRWDYFATVEPLRGSSGAAGGLTLALFDITERKVMEEELRVTDRHRVRFLALLSHELRNPLAPIRSALHVLRRAPAGGAQAASARAVIERQVDQLVRLVDDLLDVTRIATNKIRLQRAAVRFGDVVARTAEDLRPTFVEKGVRLVVRLPEDDTVVDGDETRLAQIVGNLLQNAAKFTPSGGEAIVTVAREADRVAVSVRDTGLGISPDLLPMLFEPFVQAEHAPRGDADGLGLGLSLVKSLVDLHGGDVSVASPGPGRGTEFVVHLPAVAANPRAPAAPVTAAGRSARVLVVDDNRDGAESLRLVLELNGHAVAVAHDGAQAVAVARAFQPDVVICDLSLPVMDGFDVARELRRHPTGARPRLIALSGYTLPDDVQRALEAGFDFHIAKPPDLDRLQQLVVQAD